MEDQLYMKIRPMKITDRDDMDLAEQLDACLAGRQQAANELQEEVNQILASALLWIRFAKSENKLTGDESVYNAEVNLQIAIERIRALHSTLIQDL